MVIRLSVAVSICIQITRKSAYISQFISTDQGNKMSFENIIGQKKVIKILKQALKQNRIHHGYLFHGSPGTGKEAVAIEFAKTLLCVKGDGEACNHCSNCKRVALIKHPDLIYIFPTSSTVQPEEERIVLESIAKNPYKRANLWSNPSISIDRIRSLRRVAAFKSFEDKGRVVIIAEAHQMTQAAANALLKTLEEPPGKLMFILTTSYINQLLPTIISRCQPIRFDNISNQEIEKVLIEREKVEPGTARIISRISFGNYRRALDLVEDDLQSKREKALDILRKILKSHFDRLILIEELVKKKDKIYVKELLEIISLWFRDALIFISWPDQAVAEDKLVNIDQLDTMKKFVKACPNIDFEKIIFEIENAISLINQNVNIKLILIVLFENLRRYMWRKSNV